MIRSMIGGIPTDVVLMLNMAECQPVSLNRREVSKLNTAPQPVAIYHKSKQGAPEAGYKNRVRIRSQKKYHTKRWRLRR
jgi:hypothetical protein